MSAFFSNHDLEISTPAHWAGRLHQAHSSRLSNHPHSNWWQSKIIRGPQCPGKGFSGSPELNSDRITADSDDLSSFPFFLSHAEDLNVSAVGNLPLLHAFLNLC